MQYNHPEGVSPQMRPRNGPQTHEGLGFYCDLVSNCSEFHEMTGDVGDVILLHPLMVHSASRNHLRNPRIITNPPVSLLEPFKFNRASDEEYSLVELKTIQEIGQKEVRSWKPTSPREAVIPERVRIQSQMMREEMARLAKKNGVSISETLVAA